MQAVILVGGEGTRLRPLTSTVPKPVVPLVDRPFISFMLEWLRGHGIDDVIMSCGFLADERAQRARRRLGARDPPALRRGARPARHRRRAEVRRADARRALPDAQRRRAHRHRPDRADRPARAHRRQGDARAGAGRRPDAPTAWCVLDERPLGAATSSRSRAPTRSTRNLISAGAYVLEREILELVRARAQRLDRARGVAAARRRRACTASPRRATGWTSARPRATCRAPSTSSRATSRTAVRERLGSDWLAVDERRRGARPGDPAGGDRARRERRRGRPRRQPRRARRGRVGRRGQHRRARGDPRRAPQIGEGCELRDCIVAAGCRVGARHHDHRRRGARRGRERSGRTT